MWLEENVGRELQKSCNEGTQGQQLDSSFVEEHDEKEVNADFTL